MAYQRLTARPIGSVFEVNGVGWLRVTEASYDACAFCAMIHTRCTEFEQLGPCTRRDRTDRTNIIFKLIKERNKSL